MKGGGASFGERIEILIKEVGGVRELSRIVGVSETTIRNWRDGTSDAMRENLVAVVRGTGVALAWLVMGEGPMYPPLTGEEPDRTIRLYIPLRDRDEFLRPVDGHRPGDGWRVRHHTRFFGDRIGDASVFGVIVPDDSMAPRINAGDLVFYDQSQAAVGEEGAYVLRIDGVTVVRRLQRRPGNLIWVGSDQAHLGGFALSLASLPEGLDILGRVIGLMRRM